MIRTLVDSTNIKTVGYDSDTRVLHVEFHPTKKTGESAVWAYLAVSPDEFQELVFAESLGKRFAAIKASCVGKKIAVVDRDGVEHPLEELEVAEAWG